MIDQDAEETRFHATLARSNLFVQAVAAYLVNEGFQVEITAAAGFVDRAIYTDPGSDLRYCAPGGPWQYAEIKGRNFSFAYTFPFATIIIDRATKKNLVDVYFNVSADRKFAAMVERSASQAYWSRGEVFDSTKGYGGAVIECPARLAKFVRLPDDGASLTMPALPVDTGPDLQEWIARYGGYTVIDWTAWDEAIAQWRARRLEWLQP